MRRVHGLFCLLLLWSGACPHAAAQAFAEPDWAIEARFPGPPKDDGILTPSPQGDVKVRRFYHEQDGRHFLLARFEYPLALQPGAAARLYDKSIGDIMKSRPGRLLKREPFTLGPYEGERCVIAQPRERSLREVRFVVIGPVLYMMSVEWPEQIPGAEAAAAFFATVRVRPDCLDARAVALAARWRELACGNFRLRYDATRWYRDPTDSETGVFNLLRVDQAAEAQFIAEAHPVEGGDIERAVLDTAREGAEQVSVRRRASKRRGTVELTELEFTARLDRTTYVNHGYFYTGPEGAVQLRGWAPEPGYRAVAADIEELLDGLVIVPAK
jgi:hypothetical protein